MKISVIIPFLNVDHFLADCLYSLTTQTLKDFEVLCVGTQKDDKVEAVMESYKSKLNLQVFYPGADCTAGAARNLALEKAQGECYFFLDYDDYIDSNLLELLYKTMKESGADAVYEERINTWLNYENYYQSLEEGEDDDDDTIVKKGQEYTGIADEDLLENRTRLQFISVAGIMAKNKYLFSSELKAFMDLPFLLSFLQNENRIVFCEEAKYQKRRHNDEIHEPSMTRSRDRERFEKLGQALAEIPEDISTDLLQIFHQKLFHYLLHTNAAVQRIRREETNSWETSCFFGVFRYVERMPEKSFASLTGDEKRLYRACQKKDFTKWKKAANISWKKRKMKRVIKKPRYRRQTINHMVFAKFEQKDNWVVFESFLGKQCSDSCKAIYLYMLEHFGDQYRYIWVVNDNRIEIPGNPVRIPRFSLQYYYYITRAKYWVNNMRQPHWFEKRDSQVFLETWHGTPLKKLVFDMDDVLSAKANYKLLVYDQSRNWDYLLSDNPFSTEVFQSCFDYDREKILEYGYPRNDLLYAENKEEIAAAARKKIGIPEGKKAILYAPTWRDDEYYGRGEYKFELKLNLAMLKEQLGDEYVVLLRTHYFIADAMDLSGDMEGFAFDVSRYGDIAELYLVSDICITDYSSVFFDYANLKRPILFYTYDLEKYRDTLRGFYFNIEKEVPGPLLYTTQEVIDAIEHIDQIAEEYQEKYDEFYERFCSLDDGHASERVVKKVFGES